MDKPWRNNLGRGEHFREGGNAAFRPETPFIHDLLPVERAIALAITECWMTFVGHSLVGASLAQATVPGGASWKQWLLVVNIYVLLAFFPDLPLPGWGHSRYHVSHSLFVNLMLVLCLTVSGCYLRSRTRWTTYPLVVGAAAAWLSHLPLDALYHHGQGVAIFWPFSEASLNLPLPWFATLDMGAPLIGARNLRVFLVEAVFYLPLFLAALGLRYLWRRRGHTAPL